MVACLKREKSKFCTFFVGCERRNTFQPPAPFSRSQRHASAEIPLLICVSRFIHDVITPHFRLDGNSIQIKFTPYGACSSLRPKHSYSQLSSIQYLRIRAKKALLVCRMNEIRFENGGDRSCVEKRWCIGIVLQVFRKSNGTPRMRSLGASLTVPNTN